MRVCLINPPRIQPKSWGKPSVFQPLDIAYIAALLEKAHEVRIIDVPNEGWKNLELIDGTKYRQGLDNKEVAARIKRYSPDIVGINIPFTVLSGLHPSARPADCLTYPNVDFAVIGEPEQTMFELAAALEKGNATDLEKVKGIAFKKSGEAIITPTRPPIQDLDSLPFPARHLLPMDMYFAAVKENPLRGEIRKPWTTMITSRGCPHMRFLLYSCRYESKMAW